MEIMTFIQTWIDTILLFIIAWRIDVLAIGKTGRWFAVKAYISGKQGQLRNWWIRRKHVNM